MKFQPSAKLFRRLLFLVPLGLCVLFFALWTLWSESNPEQERELRILVHEQLQEWFPEEMALPEAQFGFIAATGEGPGDGQPDVVLLHGLDEPGGIWDDLLAEFEAAGIVAWEFRYPNDQAIDRSADMLAEYWPRLSEDRPVILIGHSMGGLVIRDFVSRWRFPPNDEHRLEGAGVRGVILIATPNRGSDWARLRVWLQVRELIASAAQQRFSLFVGLREGTGAAKIDLRPGSAFLAELNERPWPPHVPIRLIAGVLAEPTAEMRRSIEALTAEFGAGELADAFEAWWGGLEEGVGDGAVPLSSVTLPEAPPPIVVAGSHRGILARTSVSDAEPPAIAYVVEIIEQWLE